MSLTILLFFPIATAAFLTHIRLSYSLMQYFVATIPFLAVGLYAWARADDVLLSYNGPLMASGFRSWAAPVAIFSIAALCAFPARGSLARIGQICIAVIVANAWTVVFAGWNS